MRQFRETQLSLTPIWGAHQHTRELQMAARILEVHAELGELVHRDLVGARRSDTGRRGLSGDQVLRIALLKQIHGLTLAFFGVDPIFLRFCGLDRLLSDRTAVGVDMQ